MDDTPTDDLTDHSRDAELDGMRIRQIAQTRRSCYRARSYAFIGAWACIVMIAQLVLLIIKQLRTIGMEWIAVAYALMIPLCVWGAIFCFKRATKYRREAEAHNLVNPTTPPDFSTLGDGSQLLKDFDRIE